MVVRTYVYVCVYIYKAGISISSGIIFFLFIYYTMRSYTRCDFLFFSPFFFLSLHYTTLTVYIYKYDLFVMRHDVNINVVSYRLFFVGFFVAFKTSKSFYINFKLVPVVVCSSWFCLVVHLT